MICHNCDGDLPIEDINQDNKLCKSCDHRDRKENQPFCFWFGRELSENQNIRPMLPTDSEERKAIPIYSGCLAYFPDALIEVAKLSKKGNEQHNPGQPLHWDRSKSGDELDALIRHLLDGDWVAVAWRALAHCQKELEKNR